MSNHQELIEKTLVVIPARRHSTRLHNKMLLAETGMPLIVHTCLAAKREFNNVIVATDSYEIYQALDKYGCKSVLTGEFESGTDRVAYVSNCFPHEYIINWQGDEPELDASLVLRALNKFAADKEADICTLAAPITTIEKLYNPNCVKVQFSHKAMEVVSFTREPSPYIDFHAASKLSQTDYIGPKYWQHIGLYIFTKHSIDKFTKLSIGRSADYKLEQLKALDNSMKIIIETCNAAPAGIDTRNDYNNFVDRIRWTCER